MALEVMVMIPFSCGVLESCLLEALLLFSILGFRFCYTVLIGCSLALYSLQFQQKTECSCGAEIGIPGSSPTSRCCQIC
ncbi:uncharacterized protein LOC125453238 isoform X3 [Stegostoma tigrinum]|uniref:uncharacterized protein LOC125453238 isoform X3 n=1 Tax=Stegostoma tigrinum TaxID=3053191 RepID=UPI00287077EB|nr:uncharacterized protein LOC125453238 isoform X3 [Stegostoma tigrinum]